ncbi:MAG TPA: hypothetical protein VLA74_06180 [Nitrososphaeraceae archaeon]|nr:hypothetical protein [Nitrososphaeraceae archaeon]
MTTLKNRSKNIVTIGLSISMLFIPLQVFAYTLQIEPYDGTYTQSQTGVAIQTYVPSTGYWKETSYSGLPPTSFNEYFDDYQMPMYADYSVCAYYLTTSEEIGCESHYRANLNIASVPIDLSPWD